MKLRLQELEIDEASPFKTDRLDRAAFASALSNLVTNVESPFVINLEASWGQGKTTFLKMWRNSLKHEGVNSLYFNAWETDFSVDPLVAFIGELSQSFSEFDLPNKENAKKQLNRLKKVGVSVLKRSIPGAVKLATMGLLDLSEVTEDVLAEVGEKIAEDQLARYEQGKKSIANFRNELEKFAHAVCLEGKPLILVVDELDRCRPDYAIRLLETVKHLFAVPNVVFVIATDAQQLSSAVHHAYGLNTASEDYLRRFFDIVISLPPPSTKKFVQSQIERYGFDESFFSKRANGDARYDKSQLANAFVGLFKSTHCSLRDQQKAFTLLAIAIQATAIEQYLHPFLLCPLIVLRIKNPGLYRSFVVGGSDHDEVLEYFRRTPEGRRYFAGDGNYSAVIEACLAASRNRASIELISSKYKKIADDDSLSQESRDRAKRILEVIGNFQFRNVQGSLEFVAQKIEMVASALQREDESEF